MCTAITTAVSHKLPRNKLCLTTLPAIVWMWAVLDLPPREGMAGSEHSSNQSYPPIRRRALAHIDHGSHPREDGMPWINLGGA